MTTTPTPPTPVAPGAAAPQSASVAAAPASGAGGPSIHVDIGAGAAGARILSSGPAVNLGSALMVGLARGRDGRDGRVAATLRLAWIDLPNDLLLSPGQVVDRLNAFVLTACPGWGARRGPFEAQACARGIGGWLTATDRDVSNARAVSRSWWSAGALLRGRATLGGGFSLELEAGVDAPLADRQFITTTPLRTVATTPPLSVLVGVGLSRRL